MSTINKIFLDSSILIEALKGNKLEFYYSLVSDAKNNFYINSIIVSEYLYFLTGFSGGSSPRSLKESGKIKDTLADQINQIEILNEFTSIEAGESALFLAPIFMSKYNLLPNDAIILATCKMHNITKLASHDTDFVLPCQEEGIELLIEKD
jgi:predicted nucleic acid-binding protein